MVSSISPTLLPHPQIFPFLLSKPYQPYPTPVPRYGPAKFSQRRDLKEEGDILSDEELEVEEMMADIRVHGHNFLIPLGKHMTLDEENADVGEPSEPGSTDTTSQSRSRSPTRSASASQVDEVVTDLDADMQDLDAEVPNEDSEASVMTDQSVADDERVDEGL
ncbi:hypothetical protein FRC12_010976 [Ceratobasidium sp. 428]|nr:hypothetical protein FRC09_001854 [Ceratobasidium sp. 395]KAG8790803.1 hypothetical protein FRC12_010976 [Ceratobasidium sp. 428]